MIKPKSKAESKARVNQSGKPRPCLEIDRRFAYDLHFGDSSQRDAAIRLGDAMSRKMVDGDNAGKGYGER
jgi:hypothetical protein